MMRKFKKFKEHETKMSEMISNNLQNTNDRLDKISKEITELAKRLQFTQVQLEGEINNIKENIWKQTLNKSKMIFWIQMTYPES